MATTTLRGPSKTARAKTHNVEQVAAASAGSSFIILLYLESGEQVHIRTDDPKIIDTIAATAALAKGRVRRTGNQR